MAQLEPDDLDWQKGSASDSRACVEVAFLDGMQARFSTDLMLVLYALVVGVVVLSAGVLFADVERLWSPSTRVITLLATTTATT